MKFLISVVTLLALVFLSSCHKAANAPQANLSTENVTRRNNVAAQLPPVITSFTPDSVDARVIVEIRGADFSPVKTENLILFNGIQAPNIISASDTLLRVFTPPGAITGRLTVTVAGQTAVSATDFIVPPPVIFSFGPFSGHVGDTITIFGFRFSGIPAQNKVVFSGDAVASVIVSTSTLLKVTVPVGAVSGEITVIEGTEKATSKTDFTVLVN